jgi:hypothetical protein
MRWVFLDNELINAGLVKHVSWRLGQLYIWFLNESEPFVLLDPDKHLYVYFIGEVFR